MKDLSVVRRFLVWKFTGIGVLENYGYQRKLCWKVFNKFDMSNLKVVSTPLVNQFKFLLDKCPKPYAKVEYMSKVP